MEERENQNFEEILEKDSAEREEEGTGEEANGERALQEGIQKAAEEILAAVKELVREERRTAEKNAGEERPAVKIGAAGTGAVGRENSIARIFGNE